MSPRSTRLAWWFAGFAYLAIAGWHVLANGTNADEGFYAIAARSVWEGDLPYRDFGYTQFPLYPYINGAIMQVIGFGLFEQRLANAGWALLTIGLGALILHRQDRSGWALLFVILFAFSVSWMHYLHIGKTYALVAFFSMGAAWLWLGDQSAKTKVWGIALLGTLAVGSRLPAAPFFGLLWLAAVVELARQDARSLPGPLALSIATPFILVAPFFLVAIDQAKFWTWDWFVESVPLRQFRVGWAEGMALAPALVLLLAGAIWSAIRLSRPPPRAWVLASSALIAVLLNIGRDGAYAEYGVMFLPVFALGLVLCLPESLSGGLDRHRALLGGGLVAINVAAPFALQWAAIPETRRSSWQVFAPPQAAEYEPALFSRMQTASAWVRQYLPADHSLWGPKIILAAETGRPVHPANRMGPFSASSDFAPERAEELNLLHLAQIEAQLRDPAVPLLAFSTVNKFNYLWSVPSFNALEGRDPEKWLSLLREEFLVVYEDRDFLIFVRKSAIEPNN